VSDLVLDASLALQWFLEDESGRQYGLSDSGQPRSERKLLLQSTAYNRIGIRLNG